MRRTSRIAIPVGLAAALCVALSAAPALAQKGVLGFGADPSAGVIDPDGGYRYTAIPAGSETVVARLRLDGARVESWTLLDGRLTVPAVAYDGSAGGLSADGETLVLNRPGLRFPQRSSEFTVLDARRLRSRETISLPGTFTYDGLSPNGRSLYLIEYTSPRDLTEYRVRAYDIERGRLDPTPIIDPDESGEDMYGTPVTRATSEDGRWEYTLYDGSEHPFVHALNVQRGTAVCIDLDFLERISYGGTALEPSPDGSRLSVVDRGEPTAVIDTNTFEARRARPPAASTPAGSPAAGGGPDWLAWTALGFGLAALAGAFILMRARRRRRGRVEQAELERLLAADRRPKQASRERDPVP